MTNFVQEQLLGHLLGALDETEQEQLAAHLQGDEGSRQELARLQGRIEPLLTLRRLYEPPPGLTERTSRFVAERAGVRGQAERLPLVFTRATRSDDG